VAAFPETGHNVVGNGSLPPQPWNKSVFDLKVGRQKLKGLDPAECAQVRQADEDAREALASKRELHVPNPLNALRIICQPDAAALLAFNSINFAAFYDISASLPYSLRKIHGFNELQIGLCFLPFGLGCFMPPLFNGPLLDWRFRRLAQKASVSIERTPENRLNDFPIEQARLPIAWPMSTIAALTVICYGWVMEKETHLAAPLILLYIMGACFVASANVCSTLIVDYYPVSPSTATAANNLCRCLFSAGATAVIIDMIESMGQGWCFTLIGLVIIAVSPLLLVILRWGPGWREQRQNHRES
jgi:MFS family permease